MRFFAGTSPIWAFGNSVWVLLRQEKGTIILNSCKNTVQLHRSLKDSLFVGEPWMSKSLTCCWPLRRVNAQKKLNQVSCINAIIPQVVFDVRKLADPVVLHDLIIVASLE